MKDNLVTDVTHLVILTAMLMEISAFLSSLANYFELNQLKFLFKMKWWK